MVVHRVTQNAIKNMILVNILPLVQHKLIKLIRFRRIICFARINYKVYLIAYYVYNWVVFLL